METEQGLSKKEMETVAETPNHLIALALQEKADPNTLSKLMDLQERWEAGQARKAFVSAMTAFKQEAPAVLKKNDQVDYTTAKGRTRYNYANLGSIVQEITAILGKHELSASWGTCQEGSNVTVTCHVTHIAGHRESVTLTGPIDESGNKNRIQAVGSTVTYLQRYTLLAALGLATGEDDDGRGGRPEQSTKPKDEIPDFKLPEAGQIPPDPNEVFVCIKDVTLKTGKGVKGDWALYKILTTDGATYQTFDKAFGETAMAEKETGMPIVINFKPKEFKGKDGQTVIGKEIVSLMRGERSPGEEG